MSVQKYLSLKFKVYAIDFPGFGKSEEPKEIWGSDDYCTFLEAFMEKMGINQPIIIGHSFGGRVAIRLASKKKTGKLILIDSAGVRPRRSAIYYIKIYSYKLAKSLLKLFSPRLLAKYKNSVGSKDYINASTMMKQILIKVVNEDLTNLLPDITIPSLLIWGENDMETPLYQAHIMNKLIPDSGLVILKGAGHFSHIDKMREFLIVIGNFLNMN
ncbi:alpha/beta hydrolase fold protein [Candidatus Magnetobacterium bavaricum]|uniref:Alpha/beta hydrolase fold protein n=1 Tax=Candidatus Magnetobacterium bavaricum TaxID=29290 RepID=A0A0F3GJ30_9BACT|nr:alpha/beta hydrolase fold protein [Candidatus Magnetobacterium bavaricum]